MKKHAKKTKLVDAPIAVASDGSVLFNVSHLLASGDEHPLEAARRMLEEDRSIFIGVAVRNELQGEVLRALDDAGAEIVAHLGSKVLRGPRGRR